MTLNDKYLIHNSKTKYFYVLDFVINKPSWKNSNFLFFEKNSFFDVWCSWRGNYESTVKHRSNFEFLNFRLVSKFFEHFYRIGRMKHSLGVSWLCNWLPVFWLKRFEGVKKDPTRHRKRTKYSHSTPEDFYLVLDMISARAVVRREKDPHKTSKKN